MSGGIPVLRILGIEIRVSMVWIVLLALITVVGAQQAAFASPSLSPVIQWAIGVGVALLFFGSVIAHELAHALVGRRRGVPSTSIVLGFIGGLAPLAIQAEPSAGRARDRVRRAARVVPRRRRPAARRDARRDPGARRRRRSPAASWSSAS